MVGGGVDGAEAVGTSGKTVGDVSSENTVLGRIVQTLEEGEDSGVGGGGLLNAGQELNDDVRVTLNISTAVRELGGGEVVLVRVHEESSLEVGDGHGDREGGVGLDDITVLGGLELGRRHVRLCGDHTHGRWVARTGLDLLSIGDGQVGDGQAEVDEVVVRSQRSNLTSGGLVLTVVLETGGDDLGVKR